MFSENLKSARQAKSISQKDIAKQLFITQQAYAKYETGVSSPNPEMLLKIAEILQVSADFLLGRGETAESKNNIATPGAIITDGEMTVITAYRKHPEMHDAVHRLLGIDKPEDEVRIAAAPKVTPVVNLDSDNFRTT